MKTEVRRRKCSLRESLSVVLILALLTPALGAKERHGAQVVVTKRDGTVLSGELLAVKGLDLVLLDESASAEVRGSLADIETVRFPRKSKWLAGAVLGAISGAIIGGISGKSKANQDPGADDLSKGDAAVLGALGYGLLGAAISSSIGDRTIKIKKADPQYLAEVAAGLRSRARNIE